MIPHVVKIIVLQLWIVEVCGQAGAAQMSDSVQLELCNPTCLQPGELAPIMDGPEVPTRFTLHIQEKFSNVSNF